MLTISEEVLLLTLDYDTGRTSYALTGHDVCVAIGGAVLMDLALADRVDTDVTHLFVVNPEPVGEVALDRVLNRIVADGERRPIDHWVGVLADDGEAVQTSLADRLVERGIAARDRFGRLLVMGSLRVSSPDGTPYRDVRRRLAGVLMNDEIPDPRDVMIISLVDACALWRGLVDDSELERLRPRIGQVAKLDLIGNSVARVIDKLERAEHARSDPFARVAD